MSTSRGDIGPPPPPDPGPAAEERRDHGPSATNPPGAEDPIQTKQITFRGSPITIVCQDNAGPCSLIAICNVLLLENRITLDLDGVISKGDLLALVADCLTRSDVKDKDKLVSNMGEFVKQLCPRLIFGLDMNPMFGGIARFKFEQGRALFHLLNIPIYHGLVVDPKDKELDEFIGEECYDDVVLKLAKLKRGTADQQNTVEEDSNSYKKIDTDEHLKWKRVEDFITKSPGQITFYGHLKLQEIREQELCVLYSYNHFSTVFKQDGILYVLLTAEAYKDDADFVWAKLGDDRGGGDLVDSSFITRKFNQSQLFSLMSDERLARHIQEQEFMNFHHQQLQQNPHVGGPSEAKEAGPNLDHGRKSIPRRKLTHIETMLRNHGGKKIGRELQKKGREIAHLREVLASKNYQETIFKDWFEPHDAGEVSNRLIPRSADGNFSAYAAAEIPKITNVIMSTENSSSSGSMNQNGFPQISDSDNYADVAQEASKNKSSNKHQHSKVQKARPIEPGVSSRAEKIMSTSKHLEDRNINPESSGPTESLAGGDHVDGVSKATSAKLHHLKLQKTRQTNSRVPPKGKVMQSVEPTVSKAAEKIMLTSKHLEDRNINPESSGPTESLAGGDHVDGVSKDTSAKLHHLKLQKTRQTNSRVRPKGKVMQSVEPNLPNAPDKSRNTRTRYGLRPQSHIKYAQSSTRTGKRRKPKNACQQNLDNPSSTGIDLDETNIGNAEIGNNNMREAEELKKSEAKAAESSLKKDTSPGVSKSTSHSADMDWGITGNNAVDGDSREGSESKNPEATAESSLQIDMSPGVGKSKKAGGSREDLKTGPEVEYAGPELIGTSAAKFTKEYLRYYSVVNWLSYHQMCFILLNKQSFDSFDPKNPNELGTHIIEKADLSHAVEKFRLIKTRSVDPSDYKDEKSGYKLKLVTYIREESYGFLKRAVSTLEDDHAATSFLMQTRYISKPYWATRYLHLDDGLTKACEDASKRVAALTSALAHDG